MLTATWLGLEVKFYHLRQRGLGLAEFIDWIAAQGCEHFIILRRKNSLSKIVASQTRVYHRGRDDRPALHQITLDPDRVEIDADSKPLVDFLHDYDERFSRLQQVLDGKSTLTLNYEDDISADPLQACGKICRFLGLDPCEFQVPFGKTNPFPLDQIVANFEEVARSLEVTPYSWMTQEE